MRRGKYERRRKPSLLPLLLAVLVILSLTVGGTVAYLSTESNKLPNDFTADDPTDPVIDSQYCVEVGDPGYAVYVRAAVVVTWQDAQGNILAEVPVHGTDYTIQWNTADWTQVGDFWYCVSSVNSGGETPPLISGLTKIVSKDGCTLTVEILSQTIQALGTTDADASVSAMEDAWGVTPGSLTGSQNG